MVRRWRNITDYDSRDIDVDAVIRRELLIRQGAVKPQLGPIQGEIISSLSPQDYCYLFVGSYRPSDSSIQIIDRADVELQQTLPFGPAGVVRAHAKVVAQMRRVPSSRPPLIEGPVAEETFVYPKNKVINIQKGRRLKRKNLT